MQSIKLYYNKLCVFLKSKNGVKFSVCVGLLGLLLILLSDCSSNSASDSSNAVSTTEFSSTDYKKDLEDSLCNLIQSVEGAGDTKVMVTIKGNQINNYVKDVKQQESSNGTIEYQSNYITINSSEGKSALISSTDLPQIEGVVILCKGGSKSSVKESIYLIVTALTGLSSDRVYVGQLED